VHNKSPSVVFVLEVSLKDYHCRNENYFRVTLNDGADRADLYAYSYLRYGKDQWTMRYHDMLTAGSPAWVEEPCLWSGLNVTYGTTVLVGTGSFDDCVLAQNPLLQQTAYCANSPCAINGVYQPAIPSDMTLWFYSSYLYTFDFFGCHTSAVTTTTPQCLLDAARTLCTSTWTEIQAANPSVGLPFLQLYCSDAGYVLNLLDAWGLDLDRQLFTSSAGYTLGAMLYEANLLPIDLADVVSSTGATGSGSAATGTGTNTGNTGGNTGATGAGSTSTSGSGSAGSSAGSTSGSGSTHTSGSGSTSTSGSGSTHTSGSGSGSNHTSGSGSGSTHTSGSGSTHTSGSGSTHTSGSGSTHTSGSGSTHTSGSGSTHTSGSGSTHTSGSGSTHTSGSGSAVVTAGSGTGTGAVSSTGGKAPEGTASVSSVSKLSVALSVITVVASLLL